jgi:multiple sugar transport system ATP-binding protein
MGRAVVRRPGLLLMDEPMSNLDAKLRTELRAELHLMQRRLDVTTVYVTHDQVEAMSLGDRVAVMRRGRIVQCAPPQHLYRHPRDVFVAQFVGSPAMNLLRGALVRDDAGLAALTGTYRIPLDGASWRWPDLDRHVGHEVIVGIRPESFLPDPEGELVLSVLRVESLGAAELVHAQVDAPVHHESEVVADGGDAADGVIGDEDDVAAGDTGEVEQIVVALEGHAATGLWRPLRLRVATDEIQLFDPATGEALPAIDR